MREPGVMARPTLQLGLAGFGRLARKYYVPALRALNGVTLSTVVDPLEASREAARAAFPGVATLADPGALFTQRLDGIIVASPPSTHLALWNLAAGAGIPVLLEKPFALRGELGQAASSERERRLLMLDLNRRFWPPYRRIRESVRAGLVGDLEFVEIWLHVDIRPWCSVTSHRLQLGEGGVLYDLGSQAVDLVRWITGADPRDVSASSESRRWENDHVLLQLRFVGGLRAHCDLAYTERAVERVVVKGRHGEIRLFDPNMAVHLGRRGTTGRSALGWAGDLAVLCYRGLRRSHSMVRYTVAAALATFTDSISRGLPFSPGFEDAAANAIWLDAAARAMELGVPVAPGGAPDVSRDRV
jgi:predicted dehydrogenase